MAGRDDTLPYAKIIVRLLISTGPSILSSPLVCQLLEFSLKTWHSSLTSVIDILSLYRRQLFLTDSCICRSGTTSLAWLLIACLEFPKLHTAATDDAVKTRYGRQKRLRMFKRSLTIADLSVLWEGLWGGATPAGGKVFSDGRYYIVTNERPGEIRSESMASTIIVTDFITLSWIACWNTWRGFSNIDKRGIFNGDSCWLTLWWFVWWMP